MPSKEAAQTGYMFGKGIYFYDSVSKALVHTEGSKLKQLTQGQSTKAYLVLSEVALGDMHKAYAAHQFKRSAPMYCHSVYGIGLFKPNKIGIRDICQPGPDFAPNQLTFDKPNALFLNVGKMGSNSDLEDIPKGVNPSDLKFNEFVVYDDSQVKMRFLVELNVVVK